MEIVHVSAECYPVAKVGGLGDVVGALPKYQQQLGHIAKVVMPMYRTAYLYNHSWNVEHKSTIHIASFVYEYTIIKESTNELGFDLYLVDINGLLDREGVYGYNDDEDRFLAFQIAVVDWIAQWQHKPAVLHVHDHHAALIPFLMQHSYAYKHLSNIFTVLTIHNAQYQGIMGWHKAQYLPAWDAYKGGLLEWNHHINSLASGIRCAHKVTTVSWSYLEELRYSANGLEALFEYEKGKCTGILNGIDTAVWNTATDELITKKYTITTSTKNKLANKEALCDMFNMDVNKPLFIFISRLIYDKGADLLYYAIKDAFEYIGRKMNFLILGSGDFGIEQSLVSLKNIYHNDFNIYIGYNEPLAHTMYAGADFLLMPSRVEPCGLNQLYALRYGTIPIVNRTGGLKDSITDISEENGCGFSFDEATVGNITHAIYRAIIFYADTKVFHKMRKKIMQIDHSWTKRTQEYIQVYN